jgi:glycosyltransferase involved in cell wall biosynthesis
MISILMPVYNGFEYLNESVGSVLAQTFGGWELIIGINGHPENSKIYETARHYESLDTRIRVVDLYFLRGKPSALNHMLRLCRYDRIAVLDVDDAWLSEKLQIQLPFLDSYDVVGTRCVYFGDSNAIPLLPTKDLKGHNFLSVNPIINSSAVIRKDLCLWTDAYHGLDDYELWLRLWRNGRSFYNCPEVLVRHRIHVSSAFNGSGRQRLELTRLRAKFNRPQASAGT